MSKYRWYIARDYDFERNTATDAEMGITYKSTVNCEGPRDADPTLPLTERFRLVCRDGDDTEVMAEGFASQDADFAPLDDFGAPYWGCNEIQYWNPSQGGRWVTL